MGVLYAGRDIGKEISVFLFPIILVLTNGSRILKPERGVKYELFTR